MRRFKIVDVGSILQTENSQDNSDLRMKKKSDLVKEHDCPYVGCSKSFNRPYRLKQHISAAHTGEKEFPCPEVNCDRIYASKYKLHLHLRNYHRITKATELKNGESGIASLSDVKKEGPVSNNGDVDNNDPSISSSQKRSYVNCQYQGCRKIYANNQSMKKHYKLVHMNVKTIAAKPNREAAKRSESLNLNKCEVCNLTFNNNRLLKKHNFKHKSFKCPEEKCSPLKPFAGRTALLKHKLEFHNAGYTCDPCGLHLGRKNLLALHIQKAHLKVRASGPFHCADCPMFYALKRNLCNHIKLKHLFLRIPCTVCDKTFASLQKMKLHLKLHEPGYNSMRQFPTGFDRRVRKDAGTFKKTISQLYAEAFLPPSEAAAQPQTSFSLDEFLIFEEECSNKM